MVSCKKKKKKKGTRELEQKYGNSKTNVGWMVGVIENCKKLAQIRLFFNLSPWRQSFKEQNRVRRLTSENSYGTPVRGTLQLAIGMLRDWPFRENMEIQLHAISTIGIEQTTRNTLFQRRIYEYIYIYIYIVYIYALYVSILLLCKYYYYYVKYVTYIYK